MRITYDADKRAKTLRERGLDFDSAPEVFTGRIVTVLDDRRDYGEERWQTFGLLGSRLVQVVWTPRGDSRHIIAMRKCNDRERTKFEGHLG